MDKKNDNLKTEGRKLLIWFSVLAVFGLIAVIGNRFFPDSPQPVPVEEVEQYTPDGFRTGCRDAITEQLKAPRTAVFEGILEQQAQVQVGPNGYFWPGVVDAQNSFGALIRTRFKCSWDRKTDTLAAKLLP
jgi:hypothetical protein